MDLPISSQDVAYAAFIAVFFTWLIQTFSRVFKAVVGRATEFNYHPKNEEAVMERCFAMFPNREVRFNGSVFSRGMPVRVVTIRRRIIEGKIIGCNNDNVVCVITQNSVIAQGIDGIEKIDQIG